MYQRHTGQVSMLETPEMFGSLPLDPNNEWIKLSKLVPWREFDQKYAENFKSKKGQRACDSRMALGSVLIKPAYKAMSDEDITREIAMNPYLQYFLGLHEYRYECPFDASMMTRFRQRITPEMLTWVNDIIIGRVKQEEGKQETDEQQNGPLSPAEMSGDEGNKTDKEVKASDEESGKNVEESKSQEEKAEQGKGEQKTNKGTLILDATCTPQDIRFPTDTSLLNEARLKTEEIIDILHEHKRTDGDKPRTYRQDAKNQYNGFSKSRKKTAKMIRKTIHKQLCYLKRNLGYIDEMEKKHPGCLRSDLTPKQYEMLQVIRKLYLQQEYMYKNKVHSVDDRIVSISQPWIRPIVRGKQKADVEFGAKVEMSIVDGFLRIEDLRWDAFNESTTLQASAEKYKEAYSHYPERILADTIFRTRENLQYCKEHGIHLNGPKLGKPYSDPKLQKEAEKLEWLESGERGEIERNFGVGKRRYALDRIVTKLKHTSEVMIHSSVLFMNLRKKLRLLLRFFFRMLEKSAHNWSLGSLAMAS